MSKPLLYQCYVMDNQDPLMLGRVRARLINDNYVDIIKSIDNPPWDEERDIWTQRDPFVFNPLLPYFIYQTPKVEEMILILYYNHDFKYQNQFYIQSLFSSPTTTKFEYIVGSQKFTGLGTQYKNPKPLKNQDGTYSNNLSTGIFPEPGHNAILGRNSSDLIIKEDEVLLRAGKISGYLQPNVTPVANNSRSFLQLTRFDNVKKLQEKKKYANLIESVVITNYLIEWVIINPENKQNAFTGAVYLYSLKPNESVNSKNLQVDSQIEDLKSLLHESNFQALSIDDTIKFINGFINQCNSSDTIDGRQIFPKGKSKFPIFFRPNNKTYSTMLSSTGDISKNLQTIFNGVKLNLSSTNRGYGLIYAINKVGIPPDYVKINEVPIYKVNNTPVTFAGLGGDKVFLLSHNSSIPGKGKINLDNTIYGIDNDKMVDELIPKTSSTVRGEELLELINKIVRFLVTHTHAYPGLPPVPVTQDGSSVSDILTELQNAVNKILNENIRLN